MTKHKQDPSKLQVESNEHVAAKTKTEYEWIFQANCKCM